MNGYAELNGTIAGAARRASRSSERFLALVVFAAIALLAAASMTFPAVTRHSSALFAAYATALAGAVAFAAIVLGWRARLIGDGPSARIAAAFVFSAPLVALYGFLFPTIGPAGQHYSDASAWAWVAWRIGFPVWVILYTLPDRAFRATLSQWLSIALATAAAAAALALSGWLPQEFLADGTVLPLAAATRGAALVATLAALSRVLFRGVQTSLDVWLGVALATLLLSSTVSVWNVFRFSHIGDLARWLTLFAMLVVVWALVSELARLISGSTRLERFVMMAQHAPTIVYMLDASGNCIYVNHRWTEVTGQLAEDALGHGWTEMIHPGDVVAGRTACGADSAAGRAYEYLLRYRSIDGTYRWHLAAATPMSRADGGIDGWYGTAADIDAQQRALQEAQRLQEEARGRERDVRRIAETIPLIAWTARPDGHVDWYNQRWYEYTGQTPSDAAGWGWERVHHPDDLPGVLARWKTSIATGAPFEGEFRMRGADGRFRWFLTRAATIRSDAGAVIRWYGTNTEIDDQRRQADQVARLYAREHAISQTLQSAYLPAFLPNVPGVDFQAAYRPAAGEPGVGGDWYDAFVLRDGRIALSIGDVSGHGLEAATAMVRLRETLRAATGFVDSDAARILETTDRAFTASIPDAIATAAFALYDPVSGRLEVACAGHPPPVLVRDGAARLLAYSGVPLGVDAQSSFETQVLTLQPGDRLVFYTDGMIESDHDVVGGEQRFLAAVERCDGDAQRLVRELLGAGQRDDVALVMLTVSEPSEQISWRFVSDDASSAADARSAFTAHLRHRDVGARDIANAELVFGELVGNVVRHAPGPIEVELRWDAAGAVLAVRDRGPSFDAGDPALPRDPLADHGRGLFIISAIAATPVVRPRSGGGKEVAVALAFGPRERPADSAGGLEDLAAASARGVAPLR